MKIKYCIFPLLLLLLFMGRQQAVAQNDAAGTATADTVADPYFGLSHYEGLVTSKINLLARAYGDSVVLRWAAEDYVSWVTLNRDGYDILRMERVSADSVELLTLATALKPLPLEAFHQKYGEKDTLALVAMAALYGQGQMDYQATKNRPGTMGAMVEHSEEQNTLYAFAIMASEWRRDLASDLAMRYIDKTAQRGHSYSYIVKPHVWDQDSTIIFESGAVNNLLNERYRPGQFTPQVRDSISEVNTVTLEWTPGIYGSFEVERREAGKGRHQTWQRITAKPYVHSIIEEEDGRERGCLFTDRVPRPGNYEYRILAHDPFGDLTEPSKPYLVRMPDIEPPSAPVVQGIYVVRKNPDDLMKDVEALVHFSKQPLEDDLTGYRIFYRHTQQTGGQWKELTSILLAPTDTLVKLDVTGLPTGMISVAAFDTAHNVTYSMPVEMRLSDLKAPDAPKNLRADARPDGHIILTWTPCPEPDVKVYDVAFANDTTHTFLLRGQVPAADSTFTDTLALDNNQRYIYYKVRAADYSTNVGDFTPWLQVERPTNLPPLPPHLDTAYVSRERIHAEWLVATDANMKFHNLLRRRTDQQEWMLLRRLDADSVAAEGYRIRMDDTPEQTRQHRYEYVVESWNSSMLCSGPSPAYSVSFAGSWVIDARIRLAGDYFKEQDEVRLAWSTEGVLPTGDHYYCLWRKTTGDDDFRFMLSIEPDAVEFTDRSLESGQTAEYRLTIQYDDGRSSQPSNIIGVKVE